MTDDQWQNLLIGWGMLVGLALLVIGTAWAAHWLEKWYEQEDRK